MDEHGAALLAQIYENPDDWGARGVFTDWLRERGDPRAELIDLQAKPLRSRQERLRMRTLIREHWREWVGPASALIVGKQLPDFDRGFLSGAILAIPDDDRRALAADPVFSTLISLTCPRGDLIVRPQMRLLRTLHVSLEALGILAERSYELPIRSLWVNADEWSAERSARIIAAPGVMFQKLEHFTTLLRKRRRAGPAIEREELDWIARSWIAARAKSVHLLEGRVAIRPCMDMLEAHPNIEWIMGSLARPGAFQLKRSRLVTVSVAYGEIDVALGDLDGVDGTGWGLEIKVNAELDDRDDFAARMRARFPSFSRVEISEPPVYSYEGGM